jgi:hypothetical protein
MPDYVDAVQNFAVNDEQRDDLGDGTSKPLSNYYNLLADAQAAYPLAGITSLDDQLDWAVIQSAIKTIHARSPQHGTLYVPGGRVYFINRPIARPNRVSFRGDGKWQTELRAVGSSSWSNLFAFLDAVAEYDTVDADYSINGNNILGDAVDTSANYEFQFRNIRIAGHTGVGIKNGGYHTRYNDLFIAGGTVGILLSSGNKASGSNGTKLDAVWCQKQIQAGVRVIPDVIESSGIRIIDCLFDDIRNPDPTKTAAAIDLLDKDPADPDRTLAAPICILISGCRFEANDLALRVAEKVSGVRFINNDVFGPAVAKEYHVVYMGSSSYFEGNYFGKATGAAINRAYDARLDFIGPNTLANVPKLVANNNTTRNLASWDGLATGRLQTKKLAVVDAAEPLTANDVSDLTGWGTGAAVSFISGTDGMYRISITAGTSPAANPTVKVSFANAWPSAPRAFTQRYASHQMNVAFSIVTALDHEILTFNGTPAAGQTYIVDVLKIGQ